MVCILLVCLACSYDTFPQGRFISCLMDAIMNACKSFVSLLLPLQHFCMLQTISVLQMLYNVNKGCCIFHHQTNKISTGSQLPCAVTGRAALCALQVSAPEVEGTQIGTTDAASSSSTLTAGQWRSSLHVQVQFCPCVREVSVSSLLAIMTVVHEWRENCLHPEKQSLAHQNLACSQVHTTILSTVSCNICQHL